MPLSFI
ncbi:uncharacterized protein FFNC_07907 [Fusarium fujikuroi]|nr:uncharacterized protein FFNC_07907 [Fusarium fujikuroi]SCV33120.1 uncharacterized protein FFFS_03629 [Fusarium fujikuroi]